MREPFDFCDGPPDHQITTGNPREIITAGRTKLVLLWVTVTVLLGYSTQSRNIRHSTCTIHVTKFQKIPGPEKKYLDRNVTSHRSCGKFLFRPEIWQKCTFDHDLSVKYTHLSNSKKLIERSSFPSKN